MQDWSKHISVASVSDVGMRRTTNQDSFEIALANDQTKWSKSGHLLLVADGMGAHAAGELATKLAADGISHLYAKYHELSPPEALKRAVIETNAEINRRGQANEEFNNMGTTCSTLTLLPYGAIIAHVGDSRVYRVRGKRIEQLTFDHSLVWEMRAAGTIPEGAESANLIPKNVITRSLGPYPDVNVDLEGPFPIQAGDVFLLCSDGLTGEVEDDEIASLLSHLEPDRAAQLLVDLANLRGGSDNTTVLIAKVMDSTIATNNNLEKPLTVGGTTKNSVSPLLYSLLGASLLGTIVCFAVQNILFAILFGAVAAVFACIIAIKFSGLDSDEKLVGEARFGRGPYTRTDQVPGAKLMSRFNEIAENLKKAANESDLPVDLAEFDKYLKKAQEAANQSNEAKTVDYFCTGLSNYMDQLRG